jgi:hypothetical protein
MTGWASVPQFRSSRRRSGLICLERRRLVEFVLRVGGQERVGGCSQFSVDGSLTGFLHQLIKELHLKKR